MEDLTVKKKKLLDKLERSGYIGNKLVREAMENLPREQFLPENVKSSAYDDMPLSIGRGQTISAPHMNGMYSSALDLPDDRPVKILEIGTGSGYQAALCAEMMRLKNVEGHVYTIERISELADTASVVLQFLGYDMMITIITGDGTLGYAEEAPYDRILVTAAAPKVPDSLIEQLAENGIMLIPVGEMHGYQVLYKITKQQGEIKKSEISGVAFVPLIGVEGFSD
ncbi:MAG TPA: protein-L-isoaspartate O-methyltransferase [Candidatus Lokiarchaeia archaeon]|nr:protein-L-isoaspartate O-methyltransferase [Candidatus Lokiarchaeia archaeon]